MSSMSRNEFVKFGCTVQHNCCIIPLNNTLEKTSNISCLFTIPFITPFLNRTAHRSRVVPFSCNVSCFLYISKQHRSVRSTQAWQGMLRETKGVNRFFQSHWRNKTTTKSLESVELQRNSDSPAGGNAMDHALPFVEQRGGERSKSAPPLVLRKMHLPQVMACTNTLVNRHIYDP